MGLEQQLSGDIINALYAGDSQPLPVSLSNPYSTKAFGMPNTYLAVTEWDQSAIPTNWTQTLNGSGAANVNPQPLPGTMGIYQLASGVTAGGRAAARFATSANLLATFTDANYTSLLFRIQTPNFPSLLQKTLTFTVVAGIFAALDVITNGLGASGTIVAINLATTVITVSFITGTFAIGNTITSGAKSGTVTNVQNGYNSAFQMGWINTASQVAGASGNTLAIMYDPANISGFNPGLITNLFLLARCVTGQVSGATGNTVLDLGVTQNNSGYDNYEIIYDNLLAQVRVYRNNILLNTLTDLSNVPGSPTRVIVAGNNLSPTWYAGNSATVALGTTGITTMMDKTIIYKVFS